MFETLVFALQWLLIAAIWIFVIAGFYRSYLEIKHVYRFGFRRSLGAGRFSGDAGDSRPRLASAAY